MQHAPMGPIPPGAWALERDIAAIISVLIVTPGNGGIATSRFDSLIGTIGNVYPIGSFEPRFVN